MPDALHHPTPTQTSLVIWQWNCRSLKLKKNTLLQYMLHAGTQPDIIALQETYGNFPFPATTVLYNPALSLGTMDTKHPLPLKQ